MRPNTPKALPFRARERNRLMLAAALVIMAPVAGLATGAFVTSQSSPRTLLTAVDDMPLGQPQDSPAVESFDLYAIQLRDSLVQRSPGSTGADDIDARDRL
jgi:hypothetical protein